MDTIEKLVDLLGTQEPECVVAVNTALSVKWFNTRAQIQRNHKGRPEAGMGMTGTIELKVTV
nr:MAG TPA: hypothetical protein [Caudoviricetes sp.]